MLNAEGASGCTAEEAATPKPQPAKQASPGSPHGRPRRWSCVQPWACIHGCAISRHVKVEFRVRAPRPRKSPSSAVLPNTTSSYSGGRIMNPSRVRKKDLDYPGPPFVRSHETQVRDAHPFGVSATFLVVHLCLTKRLTAAQVSTHILVDLLSLGRDELKSASPTSGVR